ncbi:hypothetical protein PROFUN_12317 [Planoprotostelium fungivorum]|uniref:Uncharacterized protein n=1 Tax=Planoprotostelium fungivorum TaxID=1890364 RepID=A0A2P6N7V6_9EUKA|nr:hypothetical protein PROFUN_12317 [Planoprotostelium fungivorum]
MPSTSDSNLAIILLIASSPETESLDQKEIPSHLNEPSVSQCTIGLPSKTRGKPGGTPGHVTVESSSLRIVTVSDSGKSFSAQHAKEQANNSFTATTIMEHPHLDLD